MDPLDRLRTLCLALPETTERPSHGEPTWFVRDKKTFVMFADRHHDDRVGFWCAAPEGAQEALVAEAPERFFRPPYVGHRGWLGVYLDDGEVDWNHVAEIVEDAYRQVAPKSLIVYLDESRGPTTEGPARPDEGPARPQKDRPDHRRTGPGPRQAPALLHRDPPPIGPNLR